MTEERKKGRALFWVSAAVVMVVLYPLSWGPWCFCVKAFSRDADHRVFSAWGVYRPIEWGVGRMPNAIQSPCGRYISWWLDKGNHIRWTEVRSSK